ncbi:antibiotic biosynthesis monooxygenase family protein [Frigidibacter oleivorans]|uniref:antibiotic biosynthesis monooxygenase family protein n=1 Tax=Frigidibacter oleivorans TaxID=2487129 RepID=UPI000F8E2926|nr:antibiotic biosynthesis monooxygenase [Frigidibacter oleivorans]
MYLTMNRFRIKPGSEQTFEQVWASRDSRLGEVPGFLGFHLMKGPEKEGYRLYASHTMWDSEQSFLNWTKSEAFRAAPAGAGGHRDIYMGHPELEVFESVQQLQP